jgi:hypothetical protein
MFNLCVFTRELWMNNFMYSVLNADIPVICKGMSIHTHVKCVIGLSVKSTTLKDINAYIVVSTLLFVKYVIRLSVKRAV